MIHGIRPLRAALPALPALPALLALLALAPDALAHGVSAAQRQALVDGGPLAYLLSGALHMVTGYDHLLFLFGVVFFLTRFVDVVTFVTAFTLGHSITLIAAMLLGITANAYLIDAVIALSVIYKGFENTDGFCRKLGIAPPDLLWMVFAFGLIHGFGLSTRLQELPLPEDGLIVRILAFNLGVELGQVAALTVLFARQAVDAMVERAIVEAHWLAAAVASAERRLRYNQPGWTVVLQQPQEPDPARRELYVFLDAAGRYLAASHTGR